MASGAVTDDPDQFEEAVRAFRKRVPMTDAQWASLTEAEREFAFTVSGVAQADLVNDVWDAIDRAIRDGTTLADFKRDVGGELEAAWGEKDPARLETIFRTNTMGAYNGGRHEILSNPEVRKARPYWRFDAVEDSRTTEICDALHGTIRPADDPFWGTHTPPLHFNCRSIITPLSEDEARDEGIDDEAPDAEPDEGFGRQPSGRDWQPDLGRLAPEIRKTLETRLETSAPPPPPEPEPDHGPLFPNLAPEPAPELPSMGKLPKWIGATDETFLPANNKRFIAMAGSLEKAVHAPGAVGVKQHVAADLKAAAGQYKIREAKVEVRSDVATRLRGLLKDGRATETDSLGPLEVVAHEQFHGASHPGYAWHYEPLAAANRPVAAMEEATTEILAQHYLVQYAERAGLKVAPEVKKATEQTFAPTRGPTAAGVTTAKKVAYEEFVRGFGRIVEYMDDLDAPHMSPAELDRHIAGRALQVKRLEGGTAATDQRYGLLTRTILGRHGVKATDPRVHDIRREIRQTLGDFMQAKGRFVYQSVSSLDRAIQGIIKGEPAK